MPDALQTALHAFWTSRSGSTPAWIDLVSNDIPAYPASPGIEAIMRLTEATATGSVPNLPAIDTAAHYYDAALIILAHLAMREGRD
jgi:hypothetical protein